MKAIIFDLDGTLIDSVYPHTLAWQQTLNEAHMNVPAWEIQRRIGISGNLLVRSLGRKRHRAFDDATIEKLENRHDALYREFSALQLPLPGAVELLKLLREANIAHGIATTAKRSEINESLQALQVTADTVIVDGSATANAKPEPDLFVICQERLAIDKSDCLIVGDSIWDVHAARRSGMLSVGVLSGGYAEQELANAGAMNVYRDAAELLQSIDELGLQLP